MERSVRSVTIVGGGTAGWLTALSLDNRLNRRPGSKRVQITLVESPTVPIVGVGEGTLPGLVRELEKFGLDEATFLQRCNASFKLGVRFVDWNSDKSGQPYSFIHPFNYGQTYIAGSDPLDYFLAFGSRFPGERLDSAQSLHSITEAIRLHKAPRPIAGAAWSGAFLYSYHFDAKGLAEYLREEAVSRGVQHILDDVEDARVGEGDIISHLQLRSRGAIPVELVIDCTGFKGLIISKILKEPFQPYTDHLLCDRAIPALIPHADDHTIQSCTTATALSAGWAWRIPLYNRMGTGYVYSSAFRSDEDAHLELCQHLGIDPDKVPSRVIQMRVGRLRRSWVGNCIAVGLSSGFVEPLEATAIMGILLTAFKLTQYFPNADMSDALRARFNESLNLFYDAIRDFILMHYYLASRDDPFWRAAREPAALTNSLKQNLEIWKHRLPIAGDLQDASMFGHKSYAVCLASKGYFDRETFSLKRELSGAHWQSYAARVASAKARVRALPSAYEFLSKIRHDAAASKSVLSA